MFSCVTTHRVYYYLNLVVLCTRALGHEEVLDIFRTTPHNGGHCENSAGHSHCVADDGNGGNSDFCDAASVRQIDDIGAAHGTLGTADHAVHGEASEIGNSGTTCNLQNALAFDGQVGLGRFAALYCRSSTLYRVH